MLNKIVKIFGYVIIGVSALIGVLFFLNDAKTLEAGIEAMKDLPQDMKILEVDKLAEGWSGLVLNFSIALFIGAAVLAVGFAIYKFVADAVNSPKSAIKPAIALVVVGLIFILSYSMAADTIPQFLGSQNFELTPTTCKWVETSLYGMYFFMGITVAALVYTEISRIWR